MDQNTLWNSPAGELFQRRLEQAIEGLDGVKIVADDILIIGNGATTTEVVKVQCDASASLMQEERPITYASRVLTSTVSNYAQIEKELLAIVLGVERSHQYTYGRKVIVDSDHKPLETIF